jgi:hypothetical protein
MFTVAPVRTPTLAGGDAHYYHHRFLVFFLKSSIKMPYSALIYAWTASYRIPFTSLFIIVTSLTVRHYEEEPTNWSNTHFSRLQWFPFLSAQTYLQNLIKCPPPFYSTVSGIACLMTSFTQQFCDSTLLDHRLIVLLKKCNHQV